MDEIPIYSNSTHERNQYNLGDVVKVEYTFHKADYYICDKVRLDRYNFQAHFKEIDKAEALLLFNEMQKISHINIF